MEKITLPAKFPDSAKWIFLDPEKYPDLMVRIGGFSAYFRSLSREHQYSVLQRTEHEI